MMLMMTMLIISFNFPFYSCGRHRSFYKFMLMTMLMRCSFTLLLLLGRTKKLLTIPTTLQELLIQDMNVDEDVAPVVRCHVRVFAR